MARSVPVDPAHRRLARILSLGSIASLLDTTIVSVALGRVGTEFAVPVATVAWVSTAYLLALTAVLPITGWAVARWGSRRLWLGSLTVFTLASLLCALSWSAGALIAFRVLQGLGGGMLLPLVRIVLVERAGRAQLGRLMSTIVLPTQLAPVFGPVLGGLLVEASGWRAAFLINVPIGLVALALSWRTVHDHVATPAGRLDVRGLLVLTTALVGLVYGLSTYGVTGRLGDPATLAGLGAGVVLLAGYLLHARTPSTSGPILDLRLFRDRSFAACAALVFVFGGALFGALFLLPLLLQQTRGAGVAAAGLLLAPQGLGAMAGATLAGRLLDHGGRTARRLVLSGLGLTVLGTLGLALDPVGLPVWLLVISLFVRGAGLTFSLMPTTTATYATLPAHQVPAATVATRMLQQIGGSLATAVLAVVLARGLATHPAAPAAAYATALWITVAITAAATIAALALPTANAATTPVTPQQPAAPDSESRWSRYRRQICRPGTARSRGSSHDRAGAGSE